MDFLKVDSDTVLDITNTPYQANIWKFIGAEMFATNHRSVNGFDFCPVKTYAGFGKSDT